VVKIKPYVGARDFTTSRLRLSINKKAAAVSNRGFLFLAICFYNSGSTPATTNVCCAGDYAPDGDRYVPDDDFGDHLEGKAKSQTLQM